MRKRYGSCKSWFWEGIRKGGQWGGIKWPKGCLLILESFEIIVFFSV